MDTIAQLQHKIQELELTLDRHRICPVYGVYTRTALEEFWPAQKQVKGLAIAFIDIDDLKLKNTELGQYKANRRIAEAFSEARQGEVIGRFFYGDEIVILAPADEIMKPCDRVLLALQEREMSATITITPYRGEPSLTDATKEANELNQACKQLGKGKIYSFLD